MAKTIMSSGRSDLTLARRYWKGVLWLPSYFAASCDGASGKIFKSYIEQQKKPH
jgi:putative transposase